jgi:polysaccharide biosynthesis/export protein
MLALRRVIAIALLCFAGFSLAGLPQASGQGYTGTSSTNGSLPPLPPALLQQLQDRLNNTGGSANRPAPEQDVQQLLQNERRQRADQEMRRDAAQQRPATKLESDYSRRAGAELRLFGQDALAGGPAQTPVTGAVAAGYVLGFGDEVSLNLRGQVSRLDTQHVDREGRVTFAELPPIAAAGRSFSDFRDDVLAAVKRSFINAEAYVSLGTVRQITVLVGGEVQQPGPRRLSAFASVIDALGGQLQPLASLRHVTLTHEGQSRVVDLYGLLASGRVEGSLVLGDGDELFVPVVEATVAVAGQVARPAIYEIGAGGISAGELLRLGGGLLRPSGNRLLRLALDSQGRDRMTEITAATRLGPSDVLFVERSEDIQLDQVRLDGNVNAPGLRSLHVAGTVRGLLRSTEALRPDTYLPFAALYTVDPTTLARRFEAIDLAGVLAGRTPDRALRADDALIVLSMTEIRYLGSADVQAVLVGKMPPSATTAGNEAPLQQRQSVTAALNRPGQPAAPTEVDAYAADKHPGDSPARGTNDMSSRTADDDSTRDAAPVPSGSICKSLRALAVLTNADLGARFAVGVTGRLTGETVVQNILPCPVLLERYPELLPFLLEHAATLQGEVREPGIYPLAAPTPIASLIDVAGGLSRLADRRHIELSKFEADGATGRSALQRSELNLGPAEMLSVLVGPGDSIRFNQLFNERDEGPVLLSGEFIRPGLYDLKRGEKLSTLLARAGGLTDQAYPYGAVLTRERVKKAEQEGIQRTIRELSASISANALTNQLSSTPNADSQAALAEAVQSLRSAPALGRVVFEADPGMLETHPERDIVIEPGDRIYMPKRPGSVTVTGDVLNPTTLAFIDGQAPRDYVSQAGGTLSTADTGRIFVVLPNGTAEPIGSSFWNLHAVNVPPGSTIVVPRDISEDPLLLVRDTTQVISQLAITAAALAVIKQ